MTMMTYISSCQFLWKLFAFFTSHCNSQLPAHHLDLMPFFNSDSNHHERNISPHSFCWPLWMCIHVYDLYQDIDECQTLVPSPCSCGVPGEPCGVTCTNTAPSNFCTCAKGFQLRSGGAILVLSLDDPDWLRFSKFEALRPFSASFFQWKSTIYLIYKYHIHLD